MPARLWPALDVHLPAPPALLEDLEGMILAALDDAGVSAVQELPSAWRLFFATPRARDAAAAVLRALDGGLPVTDVDVSDEDWARRSQENLGPIRVGRVRVSPPWTLNDDGDRGQVRLKPDGVIDVVIQPSMGFGTGHHATTRLCIALLQETELAGRRLLDIGTGSGVLAIVAARLGADTVIAIDDDADALASARENLDLNGITGGIALRQGDFRELAQGAFDVVTANLTGSLLVRGGNAVLRAVRPGGRLILSGVTVDEEAAVRAVYEARVPLLARLEEDGWVGLLLGR